MLEYGFKVASNVLELVLTEAQMWRIKEIIVAVFHGHKTDVFAILLQTAILVLFASILVSSLAAGDGGRDPQLLLDPLLNLLCHRLRLGVEALLELHNLCVIHLVKRDGFARLVAAALRVCLGFLHLRLRLCCLKPQILRRLAPSALTPLPRPLLACLLAAPRVRGRTDILDLRIHPLQLEPFGLLALVVGRRLVLHVLGPLLLQFLDLAALLGHDMRTVDGIILGACARLVLDLV